VLRVILHPVNVICGTSSFYHHLQIKIYTHNHNLNVTSGKFYGTRSNKMLTTRGTPRTWNSLSIKLRQPGPQPWTI